MTPKPGLYFISGSRDKYWITDLSGGLITWLIMVVNELEIRAMVLITSRDFDALHQIIPVSVIQNLEILIWKSEFEPFKILKMNFHFRVDECVKNGTNLEWTKMTKNDAWLLNWSNQSPTFQWKLSEASLTPDRPWRNNREGYYGISESAQIPQKKRDEIDV